MADEPLVMRATIDDRASGPLKKIHDQLNQFKPTPGMKAMREEMDRLRSSVQSLSGAAGIGGGMWGGVLSAGLTGGVIAGVASAISALDGYAKKVLEVRHLSREIGMTAGDIKGMEKVGERFQLGKDQIDEGLKRWAEALDLIQRRKGDVYGQLQQNNPALAEQLVNEKDTRKALGLYLSFLSKIKDAQAQKQWAELPGLGGFERLFVNGADAFRKQWAEVSAAIGKSSKDIEEQAEAFEHGVTRINEALDKLTKRGGGPVLGWLASGIELVDSTIKSRVAELQGYLDKLERLRALMGSAPDSALSKGDLLARKQGELRDIETTIRAKESAPMGDHVTTDERARRDKLTEEIRKLTEEMARAREAQAQKMSFDGGSGGGGGLAGMIQNASFTGGGFGGGGSGGGAAFGMRGRYRSGGGDDGGPTPGSGVQAPRTRGDRAAIARESYLFWRSKGLPHGAAAGMLASEDQESGFNPNAVGDGGAGRGSFQYHAPRRADILRGTGINIVGASHLDQLKAAYWEMTQGHDAGARAAWRALNRNGGISARDAGGVVSRLFERPLRDERASRGALAEGWARQLKQLADADSARKDTSENRNFPPIRTRDDWSKASGAAAAPYPLGWTGREALDPRRLRDAARAAGVGPQGPMKVDTDGTVKIDLTTRGFGDNMRARASMDGIVGGITFNRGKAMPTPSNVD